MKPHLFEIADEAYHLLSKFQKNCSILVMERVEVKRILIL